MTDLRKAAADALEAMEYMHQRELANGLVMDLTGKINALRAALAQDGVCGECGGTGELDSGGTYPWGEPAMIRCPCTERPAALAQEAEPVGEVVRTGKRADGQPWHLVRLPEDGSIDLPTGTKLYTAPPAAVPVGWKLVPEVPTDKMMLMGGFSFCGKVPNDEVFPNVRKLWDAMLAAAQEVPLAQGVEPEPVAHGTTLWLWKHGEHYLAFRHLYPCFTPGGDPQTLGEPVGWAEFRESHDRAGKGGY